MSTTSYLTGPAAVTRAANLPTLKYEWAAAGVATLPAVLSALLEASKRIDRAFPFQGAKYDSRQSNEFPRLPDGVMSPYGRFGVAPGAVVRPLAPGERLLPARVWDWDPAANNGAGGAVVPDDVLDAVVIEADAILGGDAHTARRDARDGLTGQGIAGASESYSNSGEAGGGGQELSICARSRDLVRQYRARTGRLM